MLILVVISFFPYITLFSLLKSDFVISILDDLSLFKVNFLSIGYRFQLHPNSGTKTLRIIRDFPTKYILYMYLFCNFSTACFAFTDDHSLVGTSVIYIIRTQRIIGMSAVFMKFFALRNLLFFLSILHFYKKLTATPQDCYIKCIPAPRAL
jgi:hypothetical protein